MSNLFKNRGVESDEEKHLAKEIIRELPKGLVKWYAFNNMGNALYITGKQPMDEVMREALSECGLQVECYTMETLVEIQHISNKKYDYAVITSAMELNKSVMEGAELLEKVHHLLKESGRLFLGMNNRLGIRYFCGDKDQYTGRNFDSIENYIRATVSDFDYMKGRAWARAEIENMLETAGFVNHQFFSVFPVLEYPQILLADDYTPNEKLDIRIFPQYNCSDTVFLEEEMLYDTLLQNGMLHAMANAFWIECVPDGNLSNVNQVTMSMDRGRKNAMFTIIRKDGFVEKKAVYEEGKFKLNELLTNNVYLTRHNVNMVRMKIENDICVMPYIHAQSALEYLRHLLMQDKEKFLEEMDRLWQTILQSSEHVPFAQVDWEKFEPGWEKRPIDDPLRLQWKNMALGTQDEQKGIGVILKRGYIDLVPLNSFYIDGDYIFYDQEMYVENLPAKVIMLRTIDIVYMGDWTLDHVLPIGQLKERYDLLRCGQLFYKFTRRFLDNLRNDNILQDYHKQVRKNARRIYINRQRMNYSAEEYDKIFRDIFKGVTGRKLYLFGSGQYAEAFISQFGMYYDIFGCIDNNPQKWNKELKGICIYPPRVLVELEKGTYKLVICIKNYLSVIEQLKGMGVMEFSVYTPDLSYTRPAYVPACSNADYGSKEKKKYNVGYVAGVFDLFHVGHLNLFKRAKEQCAYLIVGVVSDEGVIRNKHTTPCVPFEERIELVRACRYVDEAVEIPLENCDTDEAYRRYQFDVQFSGSDHVNEPRWQAKKEFLRKRGSDLVFFPYTQSTNSTRIKELINQKLI